MSRWTVHEGDALATLATLPAGLARTCVTSPPYYGLRDYGAAGQIGMEPTPDEYVARLVEVFREVRRILTPDGTLWLNLGDSYANDTKWGGSSGGKHVEALHGQSGVGRGRKHTGMKPKDLIGIPWRVAFALQADGWWLRSDIIWAKPNPMPESVTDRPTKAHEYLFLLAKGPRYYYDAEAVKEPMADTDGARSRLAWRQEKAAEGIYRSQRDGTGSAQRNIMHSDAAGRNRRSVWTVATTPYPGAHFATFPPALVEPCILAGSALGDTVLDPFAGAGTTGLVALRHGRRFVGVELNPTYCDLARKRIVGDCPLFNTEAAG